MNESGVLEGVLTDGNFRKWLASTRNNNLEQPVSVVSNKNFKFCYINEENHKIRTFFSDSILAIPLSRNSSFNWG